MKALFLIHSFFPNEDANTNVTYPFIKELKKYCDVDIFTNNLGNNAETDTYEGMNVYRYTFLKKPFSLVQCYKYTCPVFTKSLKDAIHYFIGKFCFCFTELFPNSINRKLKKLIKEKNYSVIVSVSAPVYTHGILYSMKGFLKKNNVKWVQLVEDPHSEFIGYSYIKEILRAYEREHYKNCDLIFAFPQLANNKNDVVNEFSHKLHLIEYPNFSVYLPKDKEYLYPQDNRIRFLYVGSLQDLVIRNPEKYYSFIKETDAPNYQFDFIVNNWDDRNVLLREKYLADKENVMIYERMNIDSCFKYMNEANILVNIGNTCVNQVPSKIFDYISMGKPIINFLNNCDDPCIEILKDYPLLLNIYPDEEPDDIVYKVTDFAEKYSNKRISKAALMNLFHKYTPQDAAKPFIDEIIKSAEQ